MAGAGTGIVIDYVLKYLLRRDIVLLFVIGFENSAENIHFPTLFDINYETCK